MKVAVIGAGIAGLTVAQEIRKLGINVDVFEKSRGVGGRLSNKRLEWANIDIGAQYFTARDERFQKQVDQWIQQGLAAPWLFDPYSLTSTGLSVLPNSIVRYVGTPKMNSIAHALADDINIQRNTRIESLTRTKECWQLLTTDDQSIEKLYDWVVLSLPVEQSKTLLQGMAIESRISEPVHDPCWALALATRGEVAADIQGIFGDETVSWVSRLSAQPGRHFPEKYSSEFNDVWMLHFSSEWSTDNSKSTNLNVAQIGFEWLSQVLAKHNGSDIQLVQHFKHYWRYARLKNATAPSSNVVDPALGIAVIGAWSSGGRVEGAYLSGLDFVKDYFVD